MSMNRFLRGLLAYIGDASPSRNSIACIGLGKGDWERLERILACVKQNKKNKRIVNDGIEDKDIERFGKYIIPFDAVGKAFIKEQISRGNAEATVKHYEQSIKRISKFLCWFDDSENRYQQLSEAQRIEEGAKKPIVLLDDINFMAEMRIFLIKEMNIKEISVATYFRDYRAIAYWLMDNNLFDIRY